MGKSQKEKGKRGEREAADLLRASFPRHADRIRRGAQSRFGGKDEPDIVGLPFHVEVSAGKAPSPHGKMMQAIADTEGRDTPIVVLTKRDREEWLVTMRYTDVPRLCMLFYGLSTDPPA